VKNEQEIVKATRFVFISSILFGLKWQIHLRTCAYMYLYLPIIKVKYWKYEADSNCELQLVKKMRFSRTY